ncbi:MAG: hypothetical protein C5B50_07725 [Verrucomicrobia bacterium]|nr:MAG: hypothetical protein C5B50_07725 [Verrucomicrobiota bacterium]
MSAQFPRLAELASFSRLGPMQYSTLNSFVFVDEAANAHTRVDYWLRPFDEFLRACSGQPLEGNPERTGGGMKLTFPFSSEAARKFAALDLPKIQFFAKAYTVESAKDMAGLMADSQYKGDRLFLLNDPAVPDSQFGLPHTSKLEELIFGPAPRYKAAAPPAAWKDLNSVHTDQSLDANERLDLPWQVLSFDANNLVIGVQNTHNTWLLYSDIWHPNWHVTVQGSFRETVKVYPAALAYKAVQLTQPGTNIVRWHFGSPLLSALFFLFALQSLAWLVGVGWMIANIFRQKESS